MKSGGGASLIALAVILLMSWTVALIVSSSRPVDEAVRPEIYNVGWCLPPAPPKAVIDKKTRHWWDYDQRRIA